MSTIYANFISGTLSVDPGSGGTTLTASVFTSMATVAAPDTMWLVLDPEGVFGAPEIVLCTTHPAAAGTCTVTRAQQSTTARAHAIGTVVRVAATKTDFDELPFKKLTTTGDILYASAANTTARLAVGAATTVLHGGTTPSYSQVVAGDIASDAVTTVKILDANVTTAKIADSNVTTAKIADSNVTTAKIADANVTTAKILDANVTTAKLATGAVTPVKMTYTKCRLTKSQTLTTTLTDISGWTEADDTSGFYVSGVSAVAPETGIYAISLQVTAHASTSALVRAAAFVNAIPILPLAGAVDYSVQAVAGNDGNYTFLSYLTAGDLVKAAAANSTAGDNALTHAFKLTIVRIG